MKYWPQHLFDTPTTIRHLEGSVLPTTGFEKRLKTIFNGCEQKSVSQ